jgi:hypothetical protein
MTDDANTSRYVTPQLVLLWGGTILALVAGFGALNYFLKLTPVTLILFALAVGFAATVAVTFLGLLNAIPIEKRHLNKLFAVLILELVALGLSVGSKYFLGDTEAAARCLQEIRQAKSLADADSRAELGNNVQRIESECSHVLEGLLN